MERTQTPPWTHKSTVLVIRIPEAYIYTCTCTTWSVLGKLLDPRLISKADIQACDDFFIVSNSLIPSYPSYNV